MNDIFRKRNMHMTLKNYSSFETRNNKTAHYGSESITYSDPKICDLLLEKIKDSETNDIFKSNIKQKQPPKVF